MNRIPHIRRIRRFTALLTAVVVGCLGLAATGTAAFARVMPPSGGDGGTAPAVAPAVTRVVVAGGTPGWQIALIAVGAAIVAAALTGLADRVRAAHRTTALPA